MPYSTRFYAGNIATGSPVLYTVPAGYVAVLRDGRFYASVSGDVEFAIEASIPGPLNVIILFNNSFAPGATMSFEGRVVLNAGDSLVGVTTGDYVIAILSGYLLSAP